MGRERRLAQLMDALVVIGGLAFLVGAIYSEYLTRARPSAPDAANGFVVAWAYKTNVHFVRSDELTLHYLLLVGGWLMAFIVGMARNAYSKLPFTSARELAIPVGIGAVVIGAMLIREI
jgi:hypothetical protein